MGQTEFVEVDFSTAVCPSCSETLPVSKQGNISLQPDSFSQTILQMNDVSLQQPHECQDK